MDLELLKYPIGRLKIPENITDHQIESSIDDIAEFPALLEDVMIDLNLETLGLKYRPDGWTIKQVIHHCADSHMNAFIRFKLTLTESSPVIKPYDEAGFAELEDCLEASVEHSSAILSGIHQRWTVLNNSLDKEELAKAYYHPGSERDFKLSEALCLYSWHCRHHYAHILQALEKKY